MSLYIDPPAWPAHGRLWSHLASDHSLEELHRFAAASGVPRRGFDRDHYDVPAELYDGLVEAGATPVSSRVLVARVAAAGLRRRKHADRIVRPAEEPLLRPRRLRRGDTVAVPAPAGVVPAERLAAGVRRLESWGLRVRLGEHVHGRHPHLPYLAAPDEQRAADFSSAWLDPDVAAVWVARGGYGSQRVVDLVDWGSLARAEPKILVGFSDVTALHAAVAARLGLVSLHGHVVTSLGNAAEASAERIRRMLFEPDSVDDLLDGHDAEPVQGGVAEGPLTGGNLALLTADLATPYARPAAGAIAVLEDIEEPPYRLDRLLTQLVRAGWFDEVAGVVLGAFTDCGDPSVVDAVFAARLAPLGAPVVKGFDVGHSSTSACVPLGVHAVLDAEAGTLRLRHPPFA